MVLGAPVPINSHAQTIEGFTYKLAIPFSMNSDGLRFVTEHSLTAWSLSKNIE
jgi:hypothetical protein